MSPKQPNIFTREFVIILSVCVVVGIFLGVLATNYLNVPFGPTLGAGVGGGAGYIIAYNRAAKPKA